MLVCAILASFMAPGVQGAMPLGSVTISRSFDQRTTITLSCENRSLGGLHSDHEDCTLACNDICTKSHSAILVPEIEIDPAAFGAAVQSLANSGDELAAWKAMKGLSDVQARLNQPVSIDLDHWNSLPCTSLERTYGLRKHTISVSTSDGSAVVATAWLPDPVPLKVSRPLVSCLCDPSGFASGDDCNYGSASIDSDVFQQPVYPSGGFLFNTPNGAHRAFDRLPKGVTAEFAGVNLGSFTLTLANNTDKIVTGVLQPGTQLIPDDSSYQRMTASARTPFRLMPGESKSYTIPALCLEMDKDEPDESVSFTAAPLNDDLLASILRKAVESNFRASWDQARLWMYTDLATQPQINRRVFPPIPPVLFGGLVSDIASAGGLRFLMQNPSVIADVGSDEMAEYILGGLGQKPNARLLLGTIFVDSQTVLDSSTRSVANIASNSEYSASVAEMLYRGALGLLTTMDPAAQIAGLSAVSLLDEGFPALPAKFGGGTTANALLFSPNEAVRTKASEVTGQPAPEYDLQTAIEVGRTDPVLAMGVECPEFQFANPTMFFCSPKLLGLSFLTPDIRQSDASSPSTSISVGNPISGGIAAFAVRTLQGEGWTPQATDTDWSNGFAGMLDLSEYGGQWIETKVCVITSDGEYEMATMPIAVDVAFASISPFRLFDDASDASRQLADAAQKLKEAREKLQELLKKQKQLREESIHAGLLQKLLICWDAMWLDSLQNTYADPIAGAIDENKQLKNGQVQPDPAKLAADLAKAKKAADDCEKELQALKDKKKALEQRRDQLKAQQDALLQQASQIFVANGYSGKTGYHPNGGYWWGYGKLGGGMSRADTQKVNNIRRQLRRLNKEYKDVLRELPGVDAAIEKKEAECAKRKAELAAAQAAKDKNDQIAANDAKLDTARDEIGDRLDKAQDAFGTKPELENLTDRLGELRGELPPGTEGWDEFWDALAEFIEAKRAKENELAVTAYDKSEDAKNLGNGEINAARNAIAEAEEEYNTQKALVTHLANSTVKKINAATTTKTPKSGNRDKVMVGTTRGHCKDSEVTSGHTKYDYNFEGELPGVAVVRGPDGKLKKTDCPDELVIYIHGFKNTDSDARDNLEVAQKTLRMNGYTGPVMGWTWDSYIDGFWPAGFYFGTSKEHANINATKLASFLQDYKKVCPKTKIRLIGHSQGARLILEALKALDEDAAFSDWRSSGHVVESVHFFGAAIDNEDVQTDEAYGKAIERQCGWLYNYWNDEDDVLSTWYGPRELNQALGEADIDDPKKAPKNYSSTDVKNEISRDTDGDGDNDESNLGDNHSGYVGVMDSDGKITSDGAMDVAVGDFNKHPSGK